MAMFHKAENNKNTQAPASMNLNADMEKIRASINGGYESIIMKEKVTNFGGEKRK